MPAQLLINSHITYFFKKREQQWLSTLITKKTKMVLTQNKQQNTEGSPHNFPKAQPYLNRF